jgi:hypothetical protein
MSILLRVGGSIGLVLGCFFPREEVLRAYPDLASEDIPVALSSAAWLAEASEMPLLAA